MFIRFEHDPNYVSWHRVAGPDGEVGSGRGPLEEMADVLAGQRVVVFAGGTEVVLTKVMVPAKKRRQLLQAVPYLLEDHFAADVEDLHFALGEVTAGEAAVAVIGRSVLEDWLARLNALEAQVSAVVPESLALPLEAGAWSILRSGDQAVVRQGEQAGLAVDADNLADVLPLMFDEAGDDRPARLVVYDAETPPLDLSALEVEVEMVATAHPLDVMMRDYSAAKAFNLLQGEYSQSERMGRLWRPWRPALALAGCLLAVQFGATVVDLVQLGGERKRLSEEVLSIYRETFPNERNVPNPRVQMERHLTALRSGGSGSGGSGFGDLLAKAGQEFKATPQLHLQRLSYKEGSLDVALLIKDLQQLDVLKKRLAEQAGLTVDIQSAASRGGQVEARLKISGQAS